MGKSRALAPDPSLIGANDSRATVRATERGSDVRRHAGYRSQDRKRNGHARRALGTDDSGAARDKEKGDPTVAPASLRDAGALRYSPLIGRRELGHPWPRTSAPFPDQRLRCSARHTGPSRHAAFAARSLCPAPGRLVAASLGPRALRGHDGRVTGPLAGRRAGAASGPQGRAHGRARVRAAQDALSANPRSPIADPQGRMPGGRLAGVPFLLVTSLWASKEK